MKLFNVLRKFSFGEGIHRRQYDVGEDIWEGTVAACGMSPPAAMVILAAAVTRGQVEPAPAPAPAGPVFHAGVGEAAKASDKS